MERFIIKLFLIVSIQMTSNYLFGQNSLVEQMEELNRLQARLESLQDREDISSEDIEKNSFPESKTLTNGRYQIINIDYQSNVPNTNTITIIKGPIKLDTLTGETWRYVVNGYDEYWKKIEE